MVWYLVPDEGHNRDGKHISYLNKQEYRACDQQLHDGLRKILGNESRSVAQIQRTDFLGQNTKFFDDFLSYGGISGRLPRLAHREHWLREALDHTSSQDIVFLDPDNGLQIKSVERHAPKGPKYVFWDEVRRFGERRQTLIVYHHLNRTAKATDQINARVREFKEKLPSVPAVIPVLFRRGSLRVFFVVPSERHNRLITARLTEMMRSAWSSHMEISGVRHDQYAS